MRKKRKIFVFFARSASKVTKNDFGNFLKTQKVFLVDPPDTSAPDEHFLDFPKVPICLKNTFFLKFAEHFTSVLPLQHFFSFLFFSGRQLPKRMFFSSKIK